MTSDGRFAVTIGCLLAVTIAATGAITSSIYGDTTLGLAFCALGIVGIAGDLAVRR